MLYIKHYLKYTKVCFIIFFIKNFFLLSNYYYTWLQFMIVILITIIKYLFNKILNKLRFCTQYEKFKRVVFFSYFMKFPTYKEKWHSFFCPNGRIYSKVRLDIYLYIYEIILIF